VFLFDLSAVAPIFAGLIAFNLLLAATARTWATWRTAIYLYEAVQVVICTVILYQLGGVMMGPLLITYAFPVILAEVFHGDGSMFAIANLAGACYGVLAWVQSRQLAEVGIDTQQQVAFVVFALLAFNFLALYTNRYGLQLRNLARHLHEQVAERTREVTAANRVLQEQARTLEEKQDELESFVYTVTHDLKGPLSAIILTADLLLQRQGPELGAEARESIAHILRLAGGTEDMIRDLLEMFRITSRPEPAVWVDLGFLVEQALESLRPHAAAKGAHVEIGALPRVWGQPRKLAHVVTNLLGNALKYVSAGRGRIEITGAVENGDVLLSVRDNGIGIPAAYQRGIFDIFGRVPDQEQVVDGETVAGTGVGLAIVRRIVEAHRGSVTVESEVGAGSRFTVRLPAPRDGVS
jgi:signal transduction histidine kinase